MNLYLRLFLMIMTTRWKRRVSILEESVTRHWVLPNDLDPYGHMNNGRYFAIADLARIRKLFRARIWQEMKKQKIYAVVAGETIQFRKPLRLFQRFAITTRLMGWDEGFFYVEQTFHRKGRVYALMIVRGRLIMKDGTMASPREILRYGHFEDLDEIRMSEVIEKWNESTKEQWEQRTYAKGYGG